LACFGDLAAPADLELRLDQGLILIRGERLNLPAAVHLR
jgi:hypothetical protein